MEISLNTILLITLLSAHFISDFILQPKKWAEEKNIKAIRSKYFYYHILVTFLTLMLFTWGNLKISLIISFVHLIIDLMKSRFDDKKVSVFIMDQVLHILTIIIIWLLFTNQFNMFLDLSGNTFTDPKLLLIFLGFILLSEPTSILISKIVSKWESEIYTKNTGLKNAGKIIGYLERFLILAFILNNSFATIGFLLGAKSIFRFGDLKDSQDHKKTEYIIIGTLLSFSIAVFSGLIINQLI